MTGPPQAAPSGMARLADVLLRRKRLVGLFWLAALVAGAALSPAVNHRMTRDLSMPGEPGYQANVAIVRIYRAGLEPPVVPVVTLPPGSTAYTTSPRLARAFAAVARALPARVAWYGNTGDRRFVAAGGRVTFGLVFPPGSEWLDLPDLSRAVAAAMSPALPSGATLRVTGIAALASSGSHERQSDSLLGLTIVGALGALVVLAFVFGSFLALAPLLIAIVAIFATFLALGLLQVFASVDFIVQYLVALLGLGVAIDYSLLVVTRWREELHRGRSGDEAARQAVATAGRAVLLSGLTVTLGLLSMLVLPVPFLRSIGYSGMLIPLISSLVAVTLLPVVLSVAGQRLDWPKKRDEAAPSRGWIAWTRAVVRLRWPAVAIGAAVLAVLAAFAPSLITGSPRSSALAKSGPAYQGLVTLRAAGIPAGVFTPIEILTPSLAAPSRLIRQLGTTAGVWGTVVPHDPGWHRDGTTLAIVLPAAESSTSQGRATLARVRGLVARDAPAPLAGGVGAQDADFGRAIYGHSLLMLGLIALVTLVVLTRAFRSLLLAVKAVVLALLSIAAVLGTLVLIWQQGHGSDAIWGVPATGAITAFIPVLVFAFLFGLSMDYEVFLLARMREEFDRTGSTVRAVVDGTARTGRLVTSAALILFLAFAALSGAPGAETKEFASALGIGILLDATVVRSLLVPALVAGFGRWSWWLPRWAARVLRVAPGKAPHDHVRPLSPR